MNEQAEQVLRRVEGFIAEQTDALAIPREAGEFIHGLVLATRARRAVEVGTSYGYSGLWIGAALQENGGRLITIDREPRKSEIATRHFAEAGLADCIECRTGVAEDILPAIDGPIDFVLNDADKENCRRYVELLLPKLADRAVVLTDNTLTHAEDLADFLTWVRGHESFWSRNVPVGNGMELSVRRDGS
ncbi:MAG TPA: class I SAM-dependent methyltransferase [Phycisphaerae bacterium]|nr:class I SAM-dependent methyltransferase [Phycisphaerae bacterium]